jgi:DNA-binding NarL/FixJ family response regulator
MSDGPAASIRIVIIDDQRLFASGMAMLVEAQPDLEVVGTAVDGRDAIELVGRVRPDVVLMDIRMPVVNGLEATRLLLDGASPDEAPRVVVLTTIRRDEAVYAALRAGASAFLTKDAAPEIVLGTIRAVHAGAPVPTEGDALALAREFAAPVEAGASARPDPLADLTTREREIYALVARGLSNQEIAQSQFVSEATVKTQVRSVLQKIGLRSRIQIVIHAYENRLVPGGIPS